MENMYHHYIIIAMIFYGRPTPKTHFSFILYSMCWTLKTFIVYICCWLDKKEACHHYFRIMSIFSLSLTFIAQASLWKNQQTHWSLSNNFFFMSAHWLSYLKTIDSIISSVYRRRKKMNLRTFKFFGD